MSLLRLKPGLAPGAVLPGFALTDETGALHRLEDYRGRWLLLFFYPQDNSPGCIREACRFNDSLDEFRELGAEILGCSGQDAASHRGFREACRLRYRLLSDPGRVLREAWKVPHLLRLVDGRCSYLAGPDGTLRWVLNDANPERHVDGGLAFLRAARKDA